MLGNEVNIIPAIHDSEKDNTCSSSIYTVQHTQSLPPSHCHPVTAASRYLRVLGTPPQPRCGLQACTS